MRRIRSMNCSCANCTSGCDRSRRSLKALPRRILFNTPLRGTPRTPRKQMRSIRPYLIVIAIAYVAVLLLGAGEALARYEASSAIREIAYATLPLEAQQTLHTIKRGGPFTFER